MRSSDNLYILIKSLTKGEKLYFKKFSSKQVKGDGNNYIRLFDAINNLVKKDDINETELKAILKSYKLINNFSVAKSYLYERILESLATQHKDELRALVNQSRILYSKNLLHLAMKSVQKTKKKAIKFKDNSTLLSMLNLEYNILTRLGSKASTDSLKKVFLQEKKIIENILKEINKPSELNSRY